MGQSQVSLKNLNDLSAIFPGFSRNAIELIENSINMKTSEELNRQRDNIVILKNSLEQTQAVVKKLLHNFDSNESKIEILENKIATMGRDFDITQDTIKTKADLKLLRKVDQRFEMYTELTEFK